MPMLHSHAASCTTLAAPGRIRHNHRRQLSTPSAPFHAAGAAGRASSSACMEPASTACAFSAMGAALPRSVRTANHWEPEG